MSLGSTLLMATMPLAAGGGGPAFDPATINPDGWWRADWASPWTPTAGGGLSGSNGNLFSATTSAGTAVNGHIPALMPGPSTGGFLRSVSAASNFVSQTAFTVVSFFQITNWWTGAEFDDFSGPPALATDQSGNWGLVASHGVFNSSVTPGIRAGVYDGIGPTGEQQTPGIEVPTGTWVMAAMRLSGGQVSCRVSQPSGTTDALAPSLVTGAKPVIGSLLMIGINYNGTTLNAFDGEIAETITWKRALSDAELVSLRGYFNARYAQALT